MNRLINTHKHVNNIPDGELDNTYKWGSKYIDMAVIIYGLVKYIKEY